MLRSAVAALAAVFPLAPLDGAAAEHSAPERFSDGEVWIAFEVTIEEARGGAHGGWDLFDGDDKQLWIGTGWPINGADQRGKWGLWSATGGGHDFRREVERGVAVPLVGQIDFGSPQPGDEAVRLWIGEPEPGSEIATLSGVTIAGVDRVKSFLAPGADYRVGTPRFARSYDALGFDAELWFTDRVRPVLAAKCFSCHGEDPEKIKGDLDMMSREGLLAGGESGEPSLVPGDPEASPMYVAVTWQDDFLEMPPKENDRLSPEQIEDLHRWIAAGAPWPEPNPDATGGGVSSITSFEPDAEGRVQVATSGGLSDDWTGRRYELGDVWAFRPRQVDGSATSIDAFVDARLGEAGLTPAPRASDDELKRRLAYGLTGLPPSPEATGLSIDEWIEHLLDSPHFGERLAQHWLDVVRYADSNGFSRDEERPQAHTYRSYVIDSFNGDKPFDRFVREQIAGDELGLAGQEALAFLWMGPFEMTNMTAAAVARQMWLDDVVNSVGVTFLGHELRCAKCHDHKFDPIPTRDFYGLQAVFAGTRHHVKAGEYKIQPQKAETISILKGGSLDSPLEPVQPMLLTAIGMVDEHPVPSAEEGRRAALANWIASDDNPLTARVIVNRVWQWYFGQGLVATPNGFGAMGAKPSHPELLDWLAEWLVASDWSIKKLSRLIVSSAAYQRSVSHPDLQRVRTVDPDGALLAVFQPRRLSAEEIRDTMLVASGELNRRIGGPSFRAEINWEVAFQPRLAMGKLVAPWQPEAKREERNRRSIYAMRIRNLGHPLMEVLNRPPSELSCEKRDETTVVTQAFSLFHGDFSNARALALADRIVRDGTTDPGAQITRAFRIVYGRTPSEAEMSRSRGHLDAMLTHHRSHQPEPDELPTEVTLTNVVERTGEANTQTFKLDRMANYERDLQPWEVSAETRALSELCLVLLNSSEFLYVY